METNFKRTIGAVIAYEMKQRDLKAVDLERDLWLGRNTIHRVKNGTFSMDILHSICTYMNVRVSVVITKAEMYMEMKDLNDWTKHIQSDSQDIHTL